MKELKTYISEGFFTNVGANNRIKQVIDTIKDASMNDKINSSIKRQTFVSILKSILKDVENNMKKGKIVFEYAKNDSVYTDRKITISLETTGSKDVKYTYTYGSKNINYDNLVSMLAFDIADDLYYEAVYPTKESSRRHSIANTIKVTEFKVS